jgi:hypothetical protein
VPDLTGRRIDRHQDLLEFLGAHQALDDRVDHPTTQFLHVEGL